MALNTPRNRASAASVALVAATLVVPSSTIDQGDRQTIANVYSGILADAPIIITEDCITQLNGFVNDTTVMLTSAITDTTMREGLISSDVVQLQGFIDDITRLDSDICC